MKTIRKRKHSNSLHMWFWIHTISSIISAILIIVLSLQCKLRKLKHHKKIAFAMAALGIIGLSGGLNCYLIFDLSIAGIHNITGFASLLTSIVPFGIIYGLGRSHSKKHYTIGYLSACFAFVSLTTGLLEYNSLLLEPLFSPSSPYIPPSSPNLSLNTTTGGNGTTLPPTINTSGNSSIPPFVANNSTGPATNSSLNVSGNTTATNNTSPPATCITLQELSTAASCWVAVDGTVYDMTFMKKWGGGVHFDCSCNTYYSQSEIPHSHASSKYYGPVVGTLCK